MCFNTFTKALILRQSYTWVSLKILTNEYCKPAAGVCFTILVIQVLSWAIAGIYHFDPLS